MIRSSFRQGHPRDSSTAQPVPHQLTVHCPRTASSGSGPKPVDVSVQFMERRPRRTCTRRLHRCRTPRYHCWILTLRPSPPLPVRRPPLRVSDLEFLLYQAAPQVSARHESVVCGVQADARWVVGGLPALWTVKGMGKERGKGCPAAISAVHPLSTFMMPTA